VSRGSSVKTSFPRRTLKELSKKAAYDIVPLDFAAFLLQFILYAKSNIPGLI
jgi:hypothetical protein